MENKIASLEDESPRRYGRSREKQMTDPQPQPNPAPEPEPIDEAADRKLANIVLGVGLLLLIGIGWWLANALFEARKADNCISSGRRNCTPIEVPRER